MDPVRVKSGCPNTDAKRHVFSWPDVVAEYDGIRKALSADPSMGDVPPAILSNQNLASLTCEVMTVMDGIYGRYSTPKPKPLLPKLPAKFFKKYDPQGPLTIILAQYISLKKELFRKAQGEKDAWMQRQLDVKKHRDHFIKRYTDVEQMLKQRGLLKLPQVYIEGSVPQADKLKKLVAKTGGSVVRSASAATHIIEPDPSLEEDDEDYLKTLAISQKRNLAFVHWWYYPDSYDEWIPLSEVQGDPEVDEPQKGPWRVAARWVRDSSLYNEWMNETDYTNDADDEVEAAVAEPQVNERKRPADDIGGSANKMARNDDYAGVPVAPAPQLPPQQKIIGTADNALRRLTNLSHARADSSDIDMPAVETEPDSPRIPVEKPPRTPKKPVNVPSRASWFKLDSVHQIEKRALREFFTAGASAGASYKTERAYREARNWMVNTWRTDPSRYLTATASRRALAGDAPAVLRIHAFLEHWGLINFQVDTSTHDDLQPTQQPVEPPKVFDFSQASVTSKRPLLGVSVHPDGMVPVAVECSSCNVSCTNVRYTSQALPDFQLCQRCFGAGRFPMNMHSVDFVRQEEAQGADGWSEADTLKLLEAIETYKDDWQAVANHIGNKTREQCVLHFTQLPIEEPFVEDALYSVAASAGGKQGGPIPFADASNPIMSQIVFLCRSVSPAVASAAAQAALTKLIEDAQAKDMAVKEEAKRMKEEEIKKETEKAREAKEAEKAKQEEADRAKNESEAAADTADDKDAADEKTEAAAPEGERTSEPVSAVDESQPKAAQGGVEPKPPATTSQVATHRTQAAAAVALAAAAMRAKAIATEEEEEIKKLVMQVVELQVRKLELKVKHLEQMEHILEREREDIERAKRQLEEDRYRLTTGQPVQQVPAAADGVQQPGMMVLNHSPHAIATMPRMQ